MTMRVIKSAAGISAFFLMFTAVSPAQAVPCKATTIDKYVKLGAIGCIDKDLKYSNFTYDGTGGTDEVKAKDVMVGFDSIGADHGLMFSAQPWDVTNTDVESQISYTVTALGRKQLVGVTLLINGAMLSCRCTNVPGDGRIFATKVMSTADLEAFYNKENKQESDSDTFKPIKSADVDDDLTLDAGPFSTASLQSMSNIFALQAPAKGGGGAGGVPEPASWAMMLCGLGAVGGMLRRRGEASSGLAQSA
jgi:hypothetical protein